VAAAPVAAAPDLQAPDTRLGVSSTHSQPAKGASPGYHHDKRSRVDGEQLPHLPAACVGGTVAAAPAVASSSAVTAPVASVAALVRAVALPVAPVAAVGTAGVLPLVWVLHVLCWVLWVR
jgi:hypothetical protein